MQAGPDGLDVEAESDVPASLPAAAGDFAGFLPASGEPGATMAESKARKVGSAGRFGARYGRVARKRVSDIEAGIAGATVDGDSVKRVGTGVWVNEETGETFTGGAYRPETPGGRGVRRSIRAALEGEEAAEEEADAGAEAETAADAE